MKYFIPILVIIFFSCKKSDNTNIVTPPIDSTTIVTLGVQKQIFGSTHHQYAGLLKANSKRIFFATFNSTTNSNEYYAGDEKDSVYRLNQYVPGAYEFSTNSISICLKPNGDIINIYQKQNAPAADTIITLINKANTTTWQLLKKEVRNSFWNTYYFNGNNSPLRLFCTETGRLYMTGPTKAAVSDDNGLNWRETFTLPAGYINTTPRGSSTIGTRNFIMSSNTLLYSDNGFETATLISFNQFNDVVSKLIKLDDQRLVLQLTTPQVTFYQSFNNGQSWSPMLLQDPSDSLSEYSNSYFCFVSGTTIRTRARYKPCNAFLTVDIDPTKKFAFYPVTKPACPIITTDQVIESCQRPDKRIYIAFGGTIGNSSFFGISRDY